MNYPDRPGFKVRGTSRVAADRIAPHATSLRDRVLAFLQANFPKAYTADEISDHVGASILSTRPRVTELRRAGLIEPTEERRQNMSGMSAICWRAVVRSGGEA